MKMAEKNFLFKNTDKMSNDPLTRIMILYPALTDCGTVDEIWRLDG